LFRKETLFAEPVGPEGLIANNCVWHPDHFRCSRCAAVITRDYYMHEGDVMCPGCILQPPGPCDKCGYAIAETYLEAMDHVWHQKCFLCYGCKKPFPSAKYWLLDGQPYDNDCYWGARLNGYCPAK
uniref:LIM zinc-binding domain-containing protein n=1 Tax=Gongylonema pulchrum TaxID=637853 RepID=A0A183E8M1_9BILA